MSSGPAISIAENDVGNITKSPVVPKDSGAYEGQNGDISHDLNLDKKVMDCLLISKEGNCSEADKTMNSCSNHVLQPTNIQNMNDKSSKRMPMPSLSRDVPYAKNCVADDGPTTSTIGASGDGLSPSKFILPNTKRMPSEKDYGNNTVKDDSLLPIGDGCQEQPCPYPSPARVSLRTYAGVMQKPRTQNEKFTHGGPAANDGGNTVIVPKLLARNPTTTSVPLAAAMMNTQSTPFEEKLEDAQLLEICVKQAEPLKEPFEISKDEAIKETVGHVHGKNLDNLEDNLPNEERGETEAEALSNSLSEKIAEFENQQEATLSVVDVESSKLSATTPRREPEKPPRMQKQRSQDRLLLMKQQKPGCDADTKRDNFSRESSVECVDSTGVDVHEFLINTLRNSARDRVILLKLEHDMMSFVGNKTTDFMKFPPMTSYHRMLVHRVAAYFGMDHNVDETGKCVIINKTSSTRLPESRFSEHFDPRQVDQPSGRRDDDMRRRSILKRTNQSRSFDRDDIKGRSLWKDSRQRSIEEREEEYEKIRARIFNNQEGRMPSSMYGRRGMSSIAAAKMASWSDRPWNSTDIESVPSAVRVQVPRPLTTRASSYSSISVLPRHNSATSVKTGSSSSISSMGGGNNSLQNYAGGRHNMANPRPVTPLRQGVGALGTGDCNNGAMYYMQQQNQGMPYLSPEGYQLVYQGGPGGTGPPGVSSPQYAQYYQVSSQPSVHNPGVGYPQMQSYAACQESPQKVTGGGIPPVSNGVEYAIVPQSPTNLVPISNGQQVTTSSSSMFAPIQNMSYSYHPSSGMPVYGPPPEHLTAGLGSVPPQSPAGLSGHPLVYSPMQQPIPHNADYQQYVVSQPSAPSDGLTPDYIGAKEAAVPVKMQTPGANAIPRAMHPVLQGNVQYAPYPHQQMQLLYAPNTHHVASGQGVTEGYKRASVAEAVKTSSQDAKLIADKELSDKMQAIVLKNLQKQGVPSDPVPESETPRTGCGPSPKSANTGQHTVADVQNHTSTVPTQLLHQLPLSEQQQTYPNQPQFQYTNSGGIQQPQTMQVYLIPRHNQVPGGASYRTYSQFMTQPQTPHVMGPGMHFVYLSPPIGGIVGMDTAVPATIPSTAQFLHNQPQQHAHSNVGTAPEPVSNTNNNNVAEYLQMPRSGQNPLQAPGKTQPNSRQYNATAASASVEAEGTSEISPVSTGAETSEPETEGFIIKPEALEVNNSHPKTVSSSAPGSAVDTFSNVTYSATYVTSNAGLRSTLGDDSQHTSTHFQTQSNQPMLLGNNIPRDYRITAVNPGNAVAFNAGVVPRYAVYPGVGAIPTVSPYLKYYTPANAAAGGSKLPDSKMVQGPPAPSSLVAVQLPKQSKLQLLPSALQPAGPIYYTPHNHMANEYSANPQSSKTACTEAGSIPQVPAADAQLSADKGNGIKAEEQLEDSEAVTPGKKSVDPDLNETSKSGVSVAFPHE